MSTVPNRVLKAVPDIPYLNPYDRLVRRYFSWLTPHRQRWSIRNLPNALTWSRALIPLCAIEMVRSYDSGHISQYLGWVAVALLLAATDALDGAFARMLKVDTAGNLGEKLDPILDKVYALTLFGILWGLIDSSFNLRGIGLLLGAGLARIGLDVLLVLGGLLFRKKGYSTKALSPGKIKFHYDVVVILVGSLGLAMVHAGWVRIDLVAGALIILLLHGCFYGIKSLAAHWKTIPPATTA